MDEQNLEQFNISAFLNELVVEMGLQNEDPAELKELKENMAEALSNEIFRAASQSLEPEAVEAVLSENEGEEDNLYLISEIVKASPSAQIAMVEAIENFKENTLLAFNRVRN